MLLFTQVSFNNAFIVIKNVLDLSKALFHRHFTCKKHSRYCILLLDQKILWWWFQTNFNFLSGMFFAVC